MRWMVAVAVLSMSTVFTANPAGAQAYPGCSVELSDVTVDPGDSITVSGTNAQPSEDVVASIEGQGIGRGTAEGDGDFSFPATIPGNLEPGTHEVQVSCGPQAASLTVTVTVGQVTPPAGRLPKTGAGGTIPLTQIAIGLIAIGGLVALTSRRRRTVPPNLSQ